jgi:transposase-like protein
MNWEELIDVVSELVKDADIRKQIYTRMIDMHTHYSEDLKDNMGIDPAWDDAIKNYIDTDQEETDEDDYNYDYEEEE